METGKTFQAAVQDTFRKITENVGLWSIALETRVPVKTLLASIETVDTGIVLPPKQLLENFTGEIPTGSIYTKPIFLTK